MVSLLGFSMLLLPATSFYLVRVAIRQLSPQRYHLNSHLGCKVNVILADDPDIPRTTCQIVQARGYTCEIHSVTTSQGYIIQLHRIPNPSQKVAFLQTGLIGTSADFIFASENVDPSPAVIGQNMGIELFKQGYDVWLSNNRGNEYAQEHTTLSVADKAFWRFSWDEISQYDIPSLINYVLSATNQTSLHYVGHSQGSAVMFALLSQRPELNSAIASFIAISPITRIGLATTSFRPLITVLKPSLLLGGEVFAENVITSTVVPAACGYPIINQFCQGVFYSVTGPNIFDLNSTRLPVYLAHMPSSTSAQNLLHFDQMFRTNTFAKYDYGALQNYLLYGSIFPPQYDLTAITHPNVHVIYALNDWFVPIVAGVDLLKQDLAGINAHFYELSDPWANHMDPLIGIKNAVAVNTRVISILAASN